MPNPEEEPAAEVQEESNGEGYEEFVAALKDKGVIVEGEKLAKDGLHLLEATSEHRQAAVHYIATVGKAESIFKEKLKAGIVDQLARTNFESIEKMHAWLDLYDWAVEYDFEPGLVYCFQYLIALPSVHGVSRRELVEAVTTINQSQRVSFNNGKGGFKGFGNGKRQPQDFPLS